MQTKLARQITLEVALAVLGGMWIYAVYQYFLEDAHPLSLLLEHLLHTVLLAGLVYMVLHFRLRAQVLRPLDQVVRHAVAISRGDFEAVDYEKAGNEIDHISYMMNQLATSLEAMPRKSWANSIQAMDTRLAYLQECDDVPSHAKAELAGLRAGLRELPFALS